MDARNVLVVITRWYGGVHLGPDRFKHINNCTRELLEIHGYISEKVFAFDNFMPLVLYEYDINI